MPADLTPEKALDEIRALIDPILDDQRSADDDYEIAMQAGEIAAAERVRAILARVTPSETVRVSQVEQVGETGATFRFPSAAITALRDGEEPI